MTKRSPQTPEPSTASWKCRPNSAAAALCLAALLCAGPAAAQESPGNDTAGSALAASGFVQPIKEITVASPLRKLVSAIEIEEGARVEKGQLLASLESRAEELEVARNEKILEKREFENKAASSLAKDKLVSKDEALEKQIELDIAKLNLEIAKHSFEMTQIRAMMPGILTRKLKEAGDSVTEAEPMFRLINTDQVILLVRLPAERAATFEEGAKVGVRIPILPDAQQRFEGVVHLKSKEIDASSGLQDIKVLIENPGGIIQAGMKAEATFPGGQ